METKNSNSVKMVMVAGLLVREDQVEGRLKALAHGRSLKTVLAEDQAKEDKRLSDQGYKPEEIACLRHANRIARLESMGLGTSSRCRIGSQLRVRTYKTTALIEKPHLVEAADKLLASN